MLARWTVSNFKSFNESNSLALAPLTLLCGANSSGKSSILQSMLLVKQTLEHSPAERVIALNGPLVQLGTFSDILNYQAARSNIDDIRLGWKLLHSYDTQPTNSPYYLHNRLDYSCSDFIFDATGHGSDKETLELQPDLRQSCVQAQYRDEDGDQHLMRLTIERNTGRGRQIQFQSNSLGDEVKLRFKVTEIDAETKDIAIASDVPNKIVGCVVHHFSPRSLVVRFDKNLQGARRASSSITEVNAIRRGRGPNITMRDFGSCIGKHQAAA